MPIQKLLHKEKYETILNSAMKYSMEFDTPNEEINAFMSYIGRANNCDRFYIFEDSTKGDFTSNTYEWCAAGVQPQKDSLQKVDKALLNTWYELFEHKQTVIIQDISDIRESESALYDLLKEQNIHNIVVAPLRIRNRVIGFFGVDNPDINESMEIKIFLSMTASFILSMLRRRNTFFKMQKDSIIKSYQAIAQIYLSMHRINIQTGDFDVIKTHDVIESNRIYAENTNFQEQLWAIAEATIANDYIEAVKAFTDFSTLEERMKDHIVIEQEFLSKLVGWCRHQFIAADRDEKGRILHVISTVEVINEAKKRENHLRYLAQTDMLTGLNNRGCGEQKIKELLKKNQQGFLALIDCDHFKSINDTYGHMVGDQVLISIAEAIARGIHKGDIAMRLGGDEFAVYMLNICDKMNAKIHIQHIFDEIGRIHVHQLHGSPIHVSMGVTFFCPKTPIDFDHLYQQSDKALYESKRTEGTIATFYDDIKHLK